MRTRTRIEIPAHLRNLQESARRACLAWRRSDMRDAALFEAALSELDRLETAAAAWLRGESGGDQSASDASAAA